MLLTNRLFTRREPARDAKKIFLFCEGRKREPQYFKFFQKLDSRINLIIQPLTAQDNNSPLGLFDLAVKTLLQPNTSHELLAGDEVWFVVDTDHWGSKIVELRQRCQEHPNWQIAQSNPCFEVWLYFHHFDNLPNWPMMDKCTTWKQELDNNLSGGFQSNRHPVLIANAIDWAGKNFTASNQTPDEGCTEVFKLARVIYSVCGKKIDQIYFKYYP